MRKTLAIFAAVSLWSGVASAQGFVTAQSEDYMLLERPMVLENGKFQGAVGFNSAKFGISLHSLAVNAAYGLMDVAEIGVGTGFNLNGASGWNKFINIGAGALVMDTEQIDIAPRVDVPLSFVSGGDTLTLVAIGADTRIKLNEQLAIFAGHGLLPILVNPASAMALALNVGVGYQANDQVALRLDTQLANIKLSGAAANTSIADAVQMGLNAIFSANEMLDVFAAFGTTDISDIGNQYSMSIGVLANI